MMMQRDQDCSVYDMQPEPITDWQRIKTILLHKLESMKKTNLPMHFDFDHGRNDAVEELETFIEDELK